MKKLLLPYAYDSKSNLVHIDKAQKGVEYFCPNCGSELLLRIGKIPEGQKYHRRNHYAHKGNQDNHCSESFLHKLFKDKCIEFIKSKITDKCDFYFKWKCEQCYEIHEGNLLKKAVDVISEYDLGICKPDIALLDKDGKVIIVIEVVVTHKPEPKAMTYYNENNIACLQINVLNFEDCEHIEEKLSNPNNVNICPNPVCDKCGHIMYKVKMVTVSTDCWKCGQKMKIAMLVANNGHEILIPSEFSAEEINIAKSLGANIQKRYSKTVNDSYMANVCEHCNAFIGNFFTHEDFYLPHDEEIDLGYKCFYCLEKEKKLKYEAELEASRKKEMQLIKLRANEGSKFCPRCGGFLRIRISRHGPFWGCENYPNCSYTENIILEQSDL